MSLQKHGKLSRSAAVHAETLNPNAGSDKKCSFFRAGGDSESEGNSQQRGGVRGGQGPSYTHQLGLGPTGLPHKLRGEIFAKFCQPQWLTDVAVNMVYAVRGTVKRIAAALGLKDETDLYPFFTLNSPRLLPAYFIPALCQETGSFAILDALEAQVGRVAFQLPAATGGVLTKELAEATQEFGALLKTSGEALLDGRLNADERRRLISACDVLVAGICEVRAATVQEFTRTA